MADESQHDICCAILKEDIMTEVGRNNIQRCLVSLASCSKVIPVALGEALAIIRCMNLKFEGVGGLLYNGMNIPLDKTVKDFYKCICKLSE